MKDSAWKPRRRLGDESADALDYAYRDEGSGADARRA